MPTTKKTVEKKGTVPKPVVAKKVVMKKTAASATRSADEKINKLEVEEVQAAEAAKGGSVISTVGRRKRSIARIRLIKNGRGTITVNGKPFDTYFSTYDLREQITAPMHAVGQDTMVDISAKVIGGGIRGQSDAVRHGIARALIVLNPTFRAALKKLGYLTRDPRQRERKKFGKLGARRSPQWSKR